MTYRLAKSLETLRSQINATFPNRDKTSDGWIGDTSHQARPSDHNPNAAGVVRAIDIDEDLNAGVDLESIITAIRASRDPRVKYIIYEKRITVQGSDLQSWKPYTGTNSHSHHAHISVHSVPQLYDDDQTWAITPVDSSTSNNKPDWPILAAGSEGLLVKILQTRLVELGYKIKIDSEFGPATKAAVINYQRKNGLTADGLVGSKTKEALEL